ncbi:hypothetical protein JMJ35_010662 [Cladonia borealis]|uniref:Ubiquitin-like domain-containing protein n=1 Tax=Cladonia borealis TaxID=184061 RepID=A0AA39QPZ1_9LECA|nr:hypothetical protein JMJ35_010662 [Cladonia borealis]
MSFGFSVSDFLAVGSLIVKIVEILRGSRSEYQELIRELENLKTALGQVDKLKGRSDQAIAVDQIKCAALTCRYPLEAFLAKIEKYEESLGLEKSVGKVKDASRKVQYALGKKDEAGLEMLDIASERTSKNQEELRDRIEASSKELGEIRGNVEAQAFAVRENTSLIQKLFWMVSGEVAAPLKSLGQTVAKVCVSTQQIYTIALELKAIRVEDALGRVFAFPSECSIEALDAEIKARFKEGPGKTEVLAGSFEIFNAKDADQIIAISGRSVLVPRMSINMAIVLEKEFAEGDKCPMPHCASRTFVKAIGGGRTCSECDVWFDKTSKKRKLDSEGKQASKHVKTLSDRNRNEARIRKTEEELAEIEHSDSEETSIDAFKRIRFNKWASDIRKGQEKLDEHMIDPYATQEYTVDALGPPSQENSMPLKFPSPPPWLGHALSRLQQAYPDDLFEGTMLRKADLPIYARPNKPLHPETKFRYFPTIKCLDCPGNLYATGPETGVNTFEVHLKNRIHREKVLKRVKGEGGD